MFSEQPATRSASASATPSAQVAQMISEDVPQSWDDARDTAFFSLTAGLFPPATTLGMTVLLASYDEEPAPVGSSASG